MQVRLLGPVDVVVDGQPGPVRGLRRKAVLAVLALHGGEIVSTDQLTDAVWGEAAPPTAVNTLQSHMSHLRTVRPPQRGRHQAREAWEDALRIFDEIDHPDRERSAPSSTRPRWRPAAGG